MGMEEFTVKKPDGLETVIRVPTEDAFGDNGPPVYPKYPSVVALGARAVSTPPEERAEQNPDPDHTNPE